MSAGVGDDFQHTEGEVTDPYAQLGHNMYKKDMLPFHTEIVKPDQQSFLDSAAEHWAKSLCPGVGRYVRDHQKWKRTNMVAYKRERAKETERMVKGANAEEAKAQKEVKKAIQGALR